MRVLSVLSLLVALSGTETLAASVSLACQGNTFVLRDGPPHEGGAFSLLLDLNDNGRFVGRFESANTPFSGTVSVLSKYYMLSAVSDGWVGDVELRAEQKISIDRNSGAYNGKFTAWSSATGLNT